MIATYKLENGEYQTPFSTNTIGELLYLLGNQPDKEFQISVDLSEVQKALKSFRIAKDKTLQDVGNSMKANYDRQTIQNIESGRRKLGLITLEDIAQSMGMKVQITFVGKCDFVKELPIEKDDYDELELSNFDES